MAVPFDLTFSINDLPLTTNAQTSMHWRKKGEYVKTWHLKVWAAVGKNKPALSLSLARLILIRFSTTEPDFDGLVSSFKPVIDGLINCSVLQNDRFENIGQPIYGWEKSTRKNSGITVRVQEISEAHPRNWMQELIKGTNYESREDI